MSDREQKDRDAEYKKGLDLIARKTYCIVDGKIEETGCRCCEQWYWSLEDWARYWEAWGFPAAKKMGEKNE